MATIVDLFRGQVHQRPDAIAVVDDKTRLTYRELNLRANRLVLRLQQMGVKPGEMVALCLNRTVEIIVSQLAVLKAGAAYVPLDPTLPRERLEFMLADTASRLIVTEKSHAQGALAGLGVPLLAEDAPPQAEGVEDEVEPKAKISGESEAYVIFTSGSTGRPKGVVVTHRNVVRLLSATYPLFEFGPDDVWTLFHSYAFDFSVWEIWGSLLTGGRLVVIPYFVSRAPKEFYNLLADEGVTILNQTPAAFYGLIDVERSGHIRPLALRKVIFGGEALNFAALRPWFARHGDSTPQLVNMYGITETTVHVTYRPVRLTDTVGETRSLIGVPIPDLAIHILDDDRQPVANGLIGEIYVSGPGVARGYLNRPDLTAERFLADPFSREPGARMYKSGDLARRTSDGDLEYLGRSDMQVKVRGFRIELGEIEAAMQLVPGLNQVCVTADSDGEHTNRLVAFFIPDRGADVSDAFIREQLKTKLPAHMVPAIMMRVDTIPLTTNGKVDRTALLQLQARREPAQPTSDAASDLEQQIATVWARVLKVPAVSRKVSFFDHGGTSLQLVRIHAELQASIAPHVAITDLFAQPTVAGLARLLEGQAATGATIDAAAARSARHAQMLRNAFRPARKSSS